MPSQPTPIKSYQDLVHLLEQDGVGHEADPATSSVRILTEQRGIAGMQLIRWQGEDGVLQFIQSIPMEIPEDKVPALESAMVRLNHALPWPGLDLNHAYRMAAYRIVLPIEPRGYVFPEEIRACFSMAVKSGADFTPTLIRVATGITAPADVLADAQKELAAAAAAAEPPRAEPAAAPAAPATPATPFRID